MNTSIENDIGDDNLTFARFKAFQDLSYRDVADLFGCTIEDARRWASGDAPDDVTGVAIIAHRVACKARLEGMSDSELQYFEKQKEKLVRRIQELEMENSELSRSFLNRASRTIKRLLTSLNVSRCKD